MTFAIIKIKYISLFLFIVKKSTNKAIKIIAEKMMYDLNLSNTLYAKNNINKNSIVMYNGMVFNDKLWKQIAANKPK